MEKPEGYPTSPEYIWERFYQLTRVPRPSKKEEKVIEYLKSAATKAGCDYKVDSIGNVVIYVSATKGYENKDAVIIQNHVDMVCDKLPEKEINFEEDPIDIVVKDGWVMADGTTLGADNGIGCAAALALMDDLSIKHPPLELLFTVDEETGLGGAINLDATLLSGKRMINMDTEEWGAFYIGCAGGEDYNVSGEFQLTKMDRGDEFTSLKVCLKGLKGGHSGIDIHKSRGNASIMLVSLLQELTLKVSYFLSEFSGGQAHNIIPRDAYAIINVKNDAVSSIQGILEAKLLLIKKYLEKEDQGVEITVEKEDDFSDTVVTDLERDRFFKIVILSPHGPYSFNWESEDPLVNLSCNQAIVSLIKGEYYSQFSLRYFIKEHLGVIDQKIRVLAQIFDLKIEKGVGYPSWSPLFTGNNLLELARDIYKKLFKSEAEVKAIHAGLECGVLKSKLGDMDIISMGPNLEAVHSPSERLEISSTNDFWHLLVCILEKL